MEPPLVGPDIPLLKGTTSRERIWWCQNQSRAFNATRKERTGRADHPRMLREVEVDVERVKTVVAKRLTNEDVFERL